MNKELEEAIKICKKIIQQNNEIVKQTRHNNDINAMQLTANCDTESKAIETLVQAVENSIPTSVVEEKIKALEKEKYILSSRDAEIKLLQELIQEKGEK